MLISILVRFALDNLILTLSKYKFTTGNSTKGKLTLGNCMDNITLGNLSLCIYTLVNFTQSNLALSLANIMPGTNVFAKKNCLCSDYKFTPLQSILRRQHLQRM